MANEQVVAEDVSQIRKQRSPSKSADEVLIEVIRKRGGIPVARRERSVFWKGVAEEVRDALELSHFSAETARKHWLRLAKADGSSSD